MDEQVGIREREADDAAPRDDTTQRYKRTRGAISQAVQALWSDIEALDLTRHVAELDVKGYTVILPDRAAPAGFADKLRNKIVEVVTRRTSIAPDLVTGSTHSKAERSLGGLYTYMLYEDPLFQDAVCNPVATALVTYLIGKKAVLSNCGAVLKGPGSEDLHLHTDYGLIPGPFPHHNLTCNVTYALSDYSRENGSVCFVPGSHRYFSPASAELGNEQRVPVECPAGSMIVWTGSIWHGAFARTAPGLRINLILNFMRPYMLPQEGYRSNVPQDILDHGSDRLLSLLGQNINYGYKEEGPQREDRAYDMGQHAFD